MHLAAVVERNGNKSKDLYPWVNIVRSTEDLFSDPEIELVVITTPNGSHYSLALEAMKKGKNGKVLYSMHKIHVFINHLFSCC